MSNDVDRVRAAMRSGEWLRTQWIAKVAGLSTLRVRVALRALGAERRTAVELRHRELGGHPIHFEIPRTEWRLP